MSDPRRDRTVEEWRIIEALRDPATTPDGVTSDAVEIAYVIYYDVGAEHPEDPTKSQVQAIARALRRLEKRGVVTGVTSERRRYYVNDTDGPPVVLAGELRPHPRPEEEMVVDRPVVDQHLEDTCHMLEQLYPDMAPADALKKWLKEMERQIN